MGPGYWGRKDIKIFAQPLILNSKTPFVCFKRAGKETYHKWISWPELLWKKQGQDRAAFRGERENVT